MSLQLWRSYVTAAIADHIFREGMAGETAPSGKIGQTGEHSASASLAESPERRLARLLWSASHLLLT